MVYYIVTFFFITILFFRVCLIKNRIFNILSYHYIDIAIKMILLNIFRLVESKNNSLAKGDIILIVYFILYFIGGYFIATGKRNLKIQTINIKRPSNFPILFFTLFAAFFLLKNINLIQEAIVNPRLFYAATRLGGGMIYYVLIPILILLYFIFLFDIIANPTHKKNTIKVLLGTTLTIGFIYIFGKKSYLLLIAFILLYTLSYTNNSAKKHINSSIFLYMLIFFVALISIYRLYFIQQHMQSDDMFMQFVNYSDEIYNFGNLVKYIPHFFYGKIFAENELLGYIPRFVWNAKPELYGNLTLGLYVPGLRSWALAKTGAPSFGPLGQVYADFGLLGIPIKLVLDWFFLLIAKSYEHKLEIDGFNFFHLWLMLIFSGIRIFVIPMTSLPLYDLIMVYIVYNMSRLKIKAQ